MSSLRGRTVALGVGGGIAAYKACELARELGKRGAAVRVAMTRNATQFVTPLTFQALTGAPVLVDLFDSEQERTYGHLAVARAAELFIVAPATADLLARINAGAADDAVTTSLVASRCPVLLAPAMNTAMWENEAVKRNVKALSSDPRIHWVGPNSGELADGDVGPGRLAEPTQIADAAELLFAPRDLQDIPILITAGPTREAIDPVRFISNPSTGRMGFAIAEAARDRGARVILVAGPTDLASPTGIECVKVTSARDMAEAVLGRLDGVGAVIAAAAVSDYRPRHAAPQKIKKGSAVEQLELERTQDILLSVSEAIASRKPKPVLVGFAAETEDVKANAGKKLTAKGLDLIVANDVSKRDRGFGVSENVATLIDASGVVDLPRMSKVALAHQILDRVAAIRSTRADEAPKTDAPPRAVRPPRAARRRTFPRG